MTKEEIQFFNSKKQAMKNILFLALAGLIATSAEAQYNSSVSGPRYGQAVNQDNTGRAVTYGQLFKTDVQFSNFFSTFAW